MRGVSRPSLERWMGVAVLVAVFAVWVPFGGGFASSNDGSHVALARALVVHGRPWIDADVELTLGVDRARRAEHWYSDRPPGTAWLALAAVWLGDELDEFLWDRTVERGKVLIRPAHPNFIKTYLARTPDGRPLARYQGTALLVTIHAMLIGLLGLVTLDRILGGRGVGPMDRAVSLVVLGLGSLWGPYSTMLFSHASAGLMVVVVVLALDGAAASAGRLALGGIGAGMAVACDYTLVLVVVPIIVLEAHPRQWGWIGVGMAPILFALGGYHQLAFGSPWAIGYDFHSNFEFARARTTTFSGDPLRGLQALWGWGRGTGVIALSPVMILGFLGLGWHRRRLALAAAPWIVLLLFHRTPWGGATEDHRYLVPAWPLLTVGLGHGLAAFRERRAIEMWSARALVLVGAGWSALQVWRHLLGWRG